MDPERVVERVIDAANGEERRYVEAVADFEVLMDAVPADRLLTAVMFDEAPTAAGSTFATSRRKSVARSGETSI